MDINNEKPAGDSEFVERRRAAAPGTHESNVYQFSSNSFQKHIWIDICLLGGLAATSLFVWQTSQPEANMWLLLLILLVFSAFFVIRKWQDQKAFHALLMESAQIDALTRINNHLGLEGALAREASRMKRHQAPFSILMIDIDDFSLINGLYGLKAGDQMLQHVSRMLGNAVRITDTIGRYSGEEFMVILANTKGKDAILVGERIRRTFLEKPFQINSEIIHASISVGVAEYSHEFDSVDKLVSHADDALKTAKGRGKNQVCGWQIS